MKFHSRDGNITFIMSSGELLHHTFVFKYGMKGYGPSFPGRKEVHLKLATEHSLACKMLLLLYIFSYS